MHSSIRHVSLTFASLWLVCLSLSSCNGLGSSASSASKDNMVLNLGQTGGEIAFFPLYVARVKGYIKAQGVTLKPEIPTVLGNGTKMTAALKSDSVEMAAGIVTDAMNLSRVDSSIRLMGSLMTDVTIDLTMNKKYYQENHLTVTSPVADKIKAMLGTKIGITGPGTASEAFLIYLMQLYGHDARKDITMVKLGSAQSSIGLGALQQGTVDGLAFPAGSGIQAENRNIGDLVISPARNDVPSIRGLLMSVLYAKQTLIDSKPNTVKAFIRAIAQAEDYIHKNPAEAVTLYQTYSKQSAAYAKTMMGIWSGSISPNPRITQKSYDISTSFHVKSKLLSIAPLYTTLAANTMIDDALSGRK